MILTRQWLPLVLLFLIVVTLTDAQDSKNGAVKAPITIKPIMPIIRIKPGQVIEWEATLRESSMRPGTRDLCYAWVMPKKEDGEAKEPKKIMINSGSKRTAVNEDIKLSWTATGFAIEVSPQTAPGTTHDIGIEFLPFSPSGPFSTSLRIIATAKD